MANINDGNAQDTTYAAADHVHNAADTTADAISDVAGKASDSASGAIGSANSAVNDAVDTAQQNVSKGLHYATGAATDFSNKATDTVKTHPIRSVLFVAVSAAIAGFVGGVISSKRA
jgi:ElaB/YqjD/DUF883 family membrane-anchored ribosome-binding protein